MFIIIPKVSNKLLTAYIYNSNEKIKKLLATTAKNNNN